MSLFPWHKRPSGHDLSAYLDGELGSDDVDRIGEAIAFESLSRQQLDDYERVSQILDESLSPPLIPQSAAFADQLLAQLISQPPGRGTKARTPADRRRLLPSPKTTATVLASIGILVTAGVTIAGLRRRRVA